MSDFLFSENIAPWVVIILAAVVTYALRVGGLFLSEWLPRTGPMRRFLDALPGTLLLSLVAPGLVSAGVPGLVAGGAVVGVTVKTGNAFIAMVVGTIIVAGFRAFGY